MSYADFINLANGHYSAMMKQGLLLVERKVPDKSKMVIYSFVEKEEVKKEDLIFFFSDVLKNREAFREVLSSAFDHAFDAELDRIEEAQ